MMEQDVEHNKPVKDLIAFGPQISSANESNLILMSFVRRMPNLTLIYMYFTSIPSSIPLLPWGREET